jgi:hypothetical protein
MKTARPASFALAAASTLALTSLLLASTLVHAGQQWKWRDASGAIQYSDRPPPAGTPDSAILSRPSNARAQVTRAPDATSAASAAASGASKPGDPELDARRKKAEEEKAAQKKAEDEKAAAQRADDCLRARSYQRSLQDGMRIVRTNPSTGEREVLDDKARADEMRRAQESIQSNCR